MEFGWRDFDRQGAAAWMSGDWHKLVSARSLLPLAA